MKLGKMNTVKKLAWEALKQEKKINHVNKYLQYTRSPLFDHFSSELGDLSGFESAFEATHIDCDDIRLTAGLANEALRYSTKLDISPNSQIIQSPITLSNEMLDGKNAGNKLINLKNKAFDWLGETFPS